MIRLCCLAVVLLFAGCNAKGGEAYPVDPTFCNVEAANLIAYTRPSQAVPEPRKEVAAEEPLPEPTPGPAEQAPAEESPPPTIVEARGPAEPRGGLMEGTITNAIDTNIERKMAKAGITWSEVQKSAKAHRAFNAAADAFVKVMQEHTPPSPLPRRDEVVVANAKTRCLILSMGAGCPGCVIVKSEATKLAEAKRYTFGSEPTNDIQLVEWHDPGAAELRHKHKATRFPTLVLVTAEGTEVARHVGSLRAPQLAEWIEASRRNRAEL